MFMCVSVCVCQNACVRVTWLYNATEALCITNQKIKVVSDNGKMLNVIE